MKKSNTQWQSEIIPFIAYIILFFLIFKMSAFTLPPIPYMEVTYASKERVEGEKAIEFQPEPSESTKHKQKLTKASSSGTKILSPHLSRNMKKTTTNPARHNVYVDSVSEKLLIEHGLPRYIARNWMKYKQKGGVVKTKEDVMKLYGMTDSIFHICCSNIVFEPSKRQDTPLMIEVNSATEEDWKKLHGIGSVLSKRIIKFRSRLGGFVRIDQVKETYGISDSLYLVIKPSLYLTNDVEKIDINVVDLDQLAIHPYIEYNQAKVIIKYRNNHKRFNTLNELLATEVVDSQWLNKLNPYLSLGSDPPL